MIQCMVFPLTIVVSRTPLIKIRDGTFGINDSDEQNNKVMITNPPILVGIAGKPSSIRE